MSSPLPPQPPLSTLRATVQSHNAYILLHAHPNQPPTLFPPKGPDSQIHRRLKVGALKWGGVVNWVWYPPPTPSCSSSTCSTIVEIEEIPGALSIPKTTATMEEPPAPRTEVDIQTEHSVVEEESYSATVFSKNGRLEIPQVTLSNVEQVEETIRQFAVEDAGSTFADADTAKTSSESNSEPDEIHIFVCTHTARDCRCGVRGCAFSRTVHENIIQREGFLGNGEKRVRLKLGEVGHVGGHQYAPNVLVYPFGDWYGVLVPEQVSSILDELNFAVELRGVRPLGKTEKPLLTNVQHHWRGRMGMSKEEQATLAQTLGLGEQQHGDGGIEVKYEKQTEQTDIICETTLENMGTRSGPSGIRYTVSTSLKTALAMFIYYCLR